MACKYVISQDGKSGRYSMVDDSSQARQFCQDQWRPIISGQYTYGGEAVMDVVGKVENLEADSGRIAVCEVFLSNDAEA